jgi:hypothetical protein
LLFETLYIIEEFFQQRRKVGRAAEIDLPLSSSVSLDNIRNTKYFRVRRVSVQGETVAGRIYSHVARDATEAKDREAFVCIVWLHDRSNHAEGAFILVAGSQEVE